MDFETSYHAIFGRPALVKFMAIPHYPYLLLKMPGPNGILSLQGNLKRAFDCFKQSKSQPKRRQPTVEKKLPPSLHK
jgi:hypothetical protein